MVTRKQKLIVLLAIQLLLTIAYILFGKNDQDFTEEISWLWVTALVFGSAVMFYAWSIRCSTCHARQVFRGLSFFDLRWPGEVCYSCGGKLSKSI